MTSRFACGCSLCRLELQLVAELTLNENGASDSLPGFSDRLPSHSSVPALLFALRKSRAAACSDGLIRDLFEARTTQPELTEGPSRTVRIGTQTVTLKHVAPSKILGAGTEAGTVIQAVRSYGQKGIHEIPVQTLAKRLPRQVKTAVKRLAPAAPTWSQPVLSQITA